MSFYNTNTLSAADYKAIQDRINNYIHKINQNEANEDVLTSNVEKLENYLKTFHHHEPGFKSWLYGMMNGAVVDQANRHLTFLWNAYKAESVSAKKAKNRERYNPDREDIERPPPVNLNTLWTNGTAPRSGNSDPAYLNRGRSAHPAAAQPHNGSPASGVFEYNSSGQNSVASSYHSQQGPLYYNAPQMTGMPPAPMPLPTQTQYQGNAFPRGPVGHQGQGMYYGGQGTSYPPQSGPWAGQGAYQGQGGAYHQ